MARRKKIAPCHRRESSSVCKYTYVKGDLGRPSVRRSGYGTSASWGGAPVSMDN